MLRQPQLHQPSGGPSGRSARHSVSGPASKPATAFFLLVLAALAGGAWHGESAGGGCALHDLSRMAMHEEALLPMRYIDSSSFELTPALRCCCVRRTRAKGQGWQID